MKYWRKQRTREACYAGTGQSGAGEIKGTLWSTQARFANVRGKHLERVTGLGIIKGNSPENTNSQSGRFTEHQSLRNTGFYGPWLQTGKWSVLSENNMLQDVSVVYKKNGKAPVHAAFGEFPMLILARGNAIRGILQICHFCPLNEHFFGMWSHCAGALADAIRRRKIALDLRTQTNARCNGLSPVLEAV